MKICNKCKIEKELSEFNKNVYNKKTGLSAWCKGCIRKNVKQNYDANKERYDKNNFDNSKWFIDLKLTLKCERCGFNHPAALDFHHLDPKEKDFKVSENKATCSPEKKKLILKEIEKCIVLCSNCHRVEHSVRINKYLKELKIVTIA